MLKKIVLFLLVITIFAACQSDDCSSAPDVSKIEMDLKIKRFDQDLFSLDSSDMKGSVQKLREKYGDFPDFYFDLLGFLGQQEPEDSLYNRLNGFTNFRTFYDTTQLVYGDISDIEGELSQSFKYIKHYLPEYELPEIFAMYSEFSNDIILPPTGNSCVISLELFFGQNYELYSAPEINIPRYISRNLDRAHISSRVISLLAKDMVEAIHNDTSLATPSKLTTLLDYMILNGKTTYLLDKFMPCTPDSIKLGYSATQTEWLEKSELSMWREVFVSKLYDTDYKSFQKYISLSPNSPDMPMEAPGNTGSYVGWKIIAAFMERNPNYSIDQMLRLNDSQKILKMSKYKPKEVK